MKRLFMLVAAVLGTVVVVGCDPEEKPVTEPVLQSFEITVDAVTKTSVTYSVTPAVLDQEYFAVVKSAESLEGVEDEVLMEAILNDVKEVAGLSGLTLSEYMSRNAMKGVATGATIKGLAVDTDYVLVVFGVDAAADYAPTTYPFTSAFTTAAVNKSDCTFSVSATVKMNTVSFDVVPSDENVSWHLFTLKKSDYDAYLDPAGDYKWDKATFYQAYVENEYMQYLGMGYSAEEVFAAMYLKGNAELAAEGLNTQTEYAWLIAGFEIEDGVAYLATDITDGTYVTENVAKSDLTFDISVTDVEQMKAAIKVTPSNNEEKFCWMVQQYDGVQTADEIMNNIVAANQMWFDMGFMLYTGVQDFTGGPESPYKFSLDLPGTDYCVIAFGYSGGITTDPEMVTFTTLPGGNPADCTFEANVTATSPYGVEFDLVPSDATVYYIADVCLASEFNAETLVAEVESGIQQMFEMQQMFDPSATITQIVSTYYWSGANHMSANSLEPDTEYMLYICALDAATGKVANVFTVDPFAKTSSLGKLSPEIELVGYYSGDDEAGSLFGQPDATAGKSIAVVKYNAPAEATCLYSSVLGGNALSTEEFSDAWMMGYISSYYWTEINMAQPYSFFVVSWAEENTVVAYTEDADGNLGVLARKLICATAEEKGNIEDLKALVDELNGTKCVASVEIASVSSDMEPSLRVISKIDTEVVPTMSTATPRSLVEIQNPELEAGHLLLLDGVSSSWMRR